MKPGTPPLQSTRLLDQVRERIRYVHYSLKTEKAYLYWIRFFIRWSATQPGGMRHPRDMGAAEVEAFLSMLANERKVSASTHNQALSAVLFLYREVLGIDLPWLNNIGRPQQTKRIPSVLTKDEVAGLLAFLEGETALLARMLYGTGMRLMEGMRLRVKDVDFVRHTIIVREAKGNKDRVVMLPRTLAPALRLQLLTARALWEQDRQAQRGGVETPHALAAKYPQVGHSWGWFWLFPSPTLSVDPRSGIEQRHHLYEERLQRTQTNCSASRYLQTRVSSYFAPQLRNPFVAGKNRHPYCAGTARPFRRQYHHDLYPCAQGRCRRHRKSAGPAGAGRINAR